MSRTKGFTLLETTIVLLVISVIAAVAVSALTSSVAATNELNVEHDLLAAGDAGLAVLERELRNTSFATGANLSEPDSLTLTFSTNTGFDTAKNQPTWSLPVTYKFVLSAAETAQITTSATTTNAYQLTRSFNGGASTVVIDSVTAPAFGQSNGCVTVSFTVARQIFLPGNRKKEVRLRSISRTYKLPS